MKNKWLKRNKHIIEFAYTIVDGDLYDTLKFTFPSGRVFYSYVYSSLYEDKVNIIDLVHEVSGSFNEKINEENIVKKESAEYFGI